MKHDYHLIQDLADGKSVFKTGLVGQANGILRELRKYRTTLETIAAQTTGKPGSTKRSDCMAALAQAALNSTDL